MSQFILDTHMHFDLYQDRNAVLKYIETNKSYTIAVTNLPDIYRRYYGQYSEYKYVKIALGFHPELAQQYQSQLDIFTDYVKTTRYIGEVGLDFSVRDEANRQNQVAVFSEIVRLCNDSPNKIMSIHSRRAEADCLKILKNYVGKVILHWYSGNQRNLQEALKRNYYFSVNHQMLLSNNGRSIVDRIPLDQLLFESDAPFTRGLERQYSITFVDKIYEYLSQSRKIALDNLNVIIKNNFRNLLG